jgi:hypothetical protein
VEAPQHPAEHHAHLHQRQVLSDATRRTVRKRYERGHVVFSPRCISIGIGIGIGIGVGGMAAEPSFWQERFWIVEVTRVTVDAVRVKGELCLFGDNPAYKWAEWRRQSGGLERERLSRLVVVSRTYSFPNTLVPLPLFTERCEPLGTGG